MKSELVTSLLSHYPATSTAHRERWRSQVVKQLDQAVSAKDVLLSIGPVTARYNQSPPR